MNCFMKWGILIVPVSILLAMLPTLEKLAQSEGVATEAPAGFDNLTNGHISQTDFDSSRATFEEQEEKGGSADTLGDGFVEAISDNTLLGIQASQPASIRGLAISVAIPEAPGSTRLGRFGWKNQHASLESFAADAYLNEMGIARRLESRQNTSDRNSPAAFDTLTDPEDVGGGDVNDFAQFMRATKVPPRDPALVGQPDTIAGELIFHSTGCDGCHTPTIVTAPAGTVLTGGFTVSTAVGNKLIHPYSDFLLHNIGTYDPVVPNGGQATYNMVRTAPLWGLRTRSVFLHDLTASTVDLAIRYHGLQAQGASDAYQALSNADQKKLLTFLNSL